MTTNEALEVVVHISDTYRWWSALAAFLGTYLITPVVWKLGRLLVADWLFGAGHFLAAARVKPEGRTAETMMEPPRRFWAMLAALVLMTGVLIAGLIIPFSHSGMFDGAMLSALYHTGFEWFGLQAAWRIFVLGAWIMWGLGSWMIVLAFSPRPRFMAAAAAIWWFAAFVASDGIGVAVE